MKNLKPTLVLFTTALIITSFITGCQKEDSPDDPDKVEGLFYYYTDVAEGRIMVIDINASTPFRRSYILSDEVTLGMIAEDRPRHVIKFYRPASVSPMAADNGMMIKSKVADSEWLFVTNFPFVGLTSIAEEKWFEASEFGEGSTGFKLHEMGEEEGEKTYAIESIKYPGNYFSHDGHPIQGANLLFLKPFDSPEKAPRFRLFETSASAFPEGDPNVPKVFEIGGQ
ncbi:MAG: hypothetical protein MUE37_04050 [Bacteroidales bacterium]|nr:hypothetical protein [Bacteroidales bacterium]